VRNLNCTLLKSSIFLLIATLFSASISAREVDTRAQQIQQISVYLDEMGYQLNHHKVEIDLFHERLKSVEDSLREGLQELFKMQGNRTESVKLKNLEESQKALIVDLKNLKNELMNCLTKQAQLEKSLQGQMKEMQANLQKALHLLTSGEESSSTNFYVVKSGDSLSLIAQHLKVSVKALKEANHLTNDLIAVGQKLRIPT
jgi:LysM repeat protein